MKNRTKITLTAKAEQIEELDLMLGFINEALDPFVSLSRHSLLSTVLEPALDRFLAALEVNGPLQSVNQFYALMQEAVAPTYERGAPSEGNV